MYLKKQFPSISIGKLLSGGVLCESINWGSTEKRFSLFNYKENLEHFSIHHPKSTGVISAVHGFEGISKGVTGTISSSGLCMHKQTKHTQKKGKMKGKKKFGWKLFLTHLLSCLAGAGKGECFLHARLLGDFTLRSCGSRPRTDPFLFGLLGVEQESGKSLQEQKKKGGYIKLHAPCT